MKKMFTYFVIDTLTESVVGNFSAINSDVAKKILDSTFKSNEKLQFSRDSLKLVYIPDAILMPETFDEVIEASIDAKWIPVEVE